MQCRSHDFESFSWQSTLLGQKGGRRGNKLLHPVHSQAFMLGEEDYELALSVSSCDHPFKTTLLLITNTFFRSKDLKFHWILKTWQRTTLQLEPQTEINFWLSPSAKQCRKSVLGRKVVHPLEWTISVWSDHDLKVHGPLWPVVIVVGRNEMSLSIWPNCSPQISSVPHFCILLTRTITKRAVAWVGSVQPESQYRSIGHVEFPKIQSGFCPIESAHWVRSGS